MHCISLLFALVALVQGDCESPETCAAQSSHAVAGSLIQHAHAASKEKARLGGYSVGHDNTQSCGVDRARIEDVADCRDAATALGLDFGAQGSYYAWPAFCFKYRERIYFNYDVAGSRSKSSAYMVCESMTTTTTTTTTTTASEAGSTTFVGVRYELGAMGSPFCVEGEVIGTHGECASSAVATALGKSFSRLPGNLTRKLSPKTPRLLAKKDLILRYFNPEAYSFHSTRAQHKGTYSWVCGVVWA